MGPNLTVSHRLGRSDAAGFLAPPPWLRWFPLLKDAQKQDSNELLFRQFGINYKNGTEMSRQGSCMFKKKVEDVVKYNNDGIPVKRLGRKVIDINSKNIAARSFWNENPLLVEELGSFTQNTDKINTDHIGSFLFETKLMPSTWVVIRIDGCHFHRFSEVHQFVKPNDEQALKLTNSCAVTVLKEFQDVIFSYGISDEFSFILKKTSLLSQRRSSEIVSAIVSLFSSACVMIWREFFPEKELKYSPTFDGRAGCYPSSKILRDYLSWRQVDCHINNQYSTCFWALVKSGRSKSQAQDYLKGAQALEKNELLRKEFRIDYDGLPIMFRRGSSVYRAKKVQKRQNGTCVEEVQTETIAVT